MPVESCSRIGSKSSGPGYRRDECKQHEPRRDAKARSVFLGEDHGAADRSNQDQRRTQLVWDKARKPIGQEIGEITAQAVDQVSAGNTSEGHLPEADKRPHWCYEFTHIGRKSVVPVESV